MGISTQFALSYLCEKAYFLNQSTFVENQLDKMIEHEMESGISMDFALRYRCEKAYYGRSV